VTRRVRNLVHHARLQTIQHSREHGPRPRSSPRP
jgi:hypothetical protein